MTPGSLNMFQKGLILVAVPLVFELVFVGTLAYLLRQSDAVAQREAVSKKIIFAADRLNRTFFNCAVSLFSYSTTSNPQFLQRYEELTEKLPREIEALKKNIHNDPEQKIAIDRIEGVSRKTSDILREIKTTLSESESFPQGTNHLRDLSSELESSLTQIQDGIAKLTEAESEIVRTSPEAEARTRQSFEKILLAGVIANIVLAFALVFFFTENIVRRLRILMENTEKFARNEDLHPPLGGSEEIAELDRSFHEMASALVESREKEHALQKMKQDLLAVVSHDMRAPLTSISLSLSFMRMGGLGELPERVVQSVTSNENQVFRLMRMIHDLLDFEKLQSGTLQIELKEAPVSRIIETSIESVSALSNQQNISITAQPSEIIVQADEDGLIRVITNLLSNAIKFSPPGGVISIEVIEHPEVVEFNVTDEGPGVPEDFKAVIFERFKQVQASDHKQKKGTGLGLAICKGLVEDHGGTIGVRDAAKRGSTFWFQIPRLQSAQDILIS